MSQTEPSDRHLLDRRFADPLEQRPVPVIDQQRIDRVWRRLQEAEATTRRRPGWTWRLTKMAVPVALATAIAALLLLRRSPDGGVLLAVAPEIALTPGSELVGDSQREDLELRDGSRLQLGSGVRLQILENDSQRFVTQLHQGLVRFQVRPGGRRRWTIETALATIEVVGTVFTVERDLYEVRIAVERGTVIVRGEGVPGRVARLLANQQLVVQARPQTPSSPSFEPPARELPASPPSNISPERANSGESDTAQIVTSPAGAPTVPSVSREPSLVRPPLRRVRRPDAQPSAPPAASPNSIALALQHADRLRELGDPAAAAEQLEDALLAHPKDAAAGLVEFTLGRLYLDRLGEPTRAARAFAAVLSRGAPQPLLEDALARYCEALWKAGQREAARAEFSKYQRTYPRGSRRAALAVLLAPP